MCLSNLPHAYSLMGNGHGNILDYLYCSRTYDLLEDLVLQLVYTKLRLRKSEEELCL